MYLRVTRARFDPARIEEVLAIGREIGAAYQRLPGFQGYHAGADRASGMAVSISFWDTEEHAQFPRDALGDVAQRVAASGGQLEPPEVYEETIRS